MEAHMVEKMEQLSGEEDSPVKPPTNSVLLFPFSAHFHSSLNRHSNYLRNSGLFKNMRNGTSEFLNLALWSISFSWEFEFFNANRFPKTLKERNSPSSSIQNKSPHYFLSMTFIAQTKIMSLIDIVHQNNCMNSWIFCCIYFSEPVLSQSVDTVDKSSHQIIPHYNYHCTIIFNLPGYKVPKAIHHLT